MTKTAVFALAFAFLLPAAVQAQGAYVGAGAGTSIADIPDSQIPVANAQNYSLSKNETATTYRILAGYRFAYYVAIEAAWIDLGTVSATRTVSAPFMGSATGSLRASALSLDVVGTMPIGAGVAALGRLGVMASRARDSRSVAGSIILENGSEVTQSATKVDYGLGLQYKANASWLFRGEWERAQVDW